MALDNALPRNTLRNNFRNTASRLMTLLRTFLSASFVALSAVAANAHEFWISPLDFEVAEGEAITADLRVGQKFEGTVFSYLPNTFRRFEIVQGDVATPVEGRMGDRPALNQAAPGEGLAIVVHVTTDSILTYAKADLFPSFVRHKDAEWVLARHAERGLPETGFREGYSRYAKSLVAVGEGAGSDRAVGLETEIVALANPYTQDVSTGMPVQVLYKGTGKPEAQVEVFDRAPDGTVEVTTVKADADGRATVPVRAGHVYMLDSVVLREPEGELAERPDIAWESLWANLTFEVPG